jgi:hypothetical protein
MSQAVKQFRATDVGKISVANRYLLIDPVRGKSDKHEIRAHATH